MIVTMLLIANGAIRFETSNASATPVLTLNLLQAMDAFEVARQGFAIDDPYLQFAMQSSLYWIRKSRADLQLAFDSHEQSKMGLDEFSQNSRRLAKVILQQVKHFIGQDGVPKGHKKTLEIHIAQGEAGLLAVNLPPPT